MVQKLYSFSLLRLVALDKHGASLKLANELILPLL